MITATETETGQPLPYAHLVTKSSNTPGQPSKITIIFGHKVTKYYKGKLQTVIEDLDLPNPVIRTHYAHGSLKQYVRDHLCLRTEPATNDVTAYGVKKAVENLPQLREKLSAVCDNYLNVQQDILGSTPLGLLISTAQIEVAAMLKGTNIRSEPNQIR